MNTINPKSTWWFWAAIGVAGFMLLAGAAGQSDDRVYLGR